MRSQTMATYRALLSASPKLAAEAAELALEHGYSVNSVAATVLEIREQAMAAGVQQERARAIAEMEAAR